MGVEEVRLTFHERRLIPSPWGPCSLAPPPHKRDPVPSTHTHSPPRHISPRQVVLFLLRRTKATVLLNALLPRGNIKIQVNRGRGNSQSKAAPERWGARIESVNNRLRHQVRARRRMRRQQYANKLTRATDSDFRSTHCRRRPFGRRSIAAG